MKYYIDGKFELSGNAKIPFDDAGFLYTSTFYFGGIYIPIP